MLGELRLCLPWRLVRRIGRTRQRALGTLDALTMQQRPVDPSLCLLSGRTSFRTPIPFSNSPNHYVRRHGLLDQPRQSTFDRRVLHAVGACARRIPGEILLASTVPVIVHLLSPVKLCEIWCRHISFCVLNTLSWADGLFERFLSLLILDISLSRLGFFRVGAGCRICSVRADSAV